MSKTTTTTAKAAQADTTPATTIHAKIRAVREAVDGNLVGRSKAPSNKGGKHYISYTDLLDALRGPLADAGLRLSLATKPTEFGVLVVTAMLSDDNGDAVSSDYCVAMPVQPTTRDGKPMDDFPAWGAAQSYAWRMGILGALGLRDESEEAHAKRVEAQEREAQRAAPAADATADDKEARANSLRAAGSALGLDRDGLLRAIHDATDSDRLRQWIAGGRDPLDLTEQGWGVLVNALESVMSSGIDDDVPL